MQSKRKKPTKVTIIFNRFYFFLVVFHPLNSYFCKMVFRKQLENGTKKEDAIAYLQSVYNIVSKQDESTK